MKPLRLCAIQIMRKNMKIGERGQVTIPKDLQERFGLKPETEVEFEVVNNSRRRNSSLVIVAFTERFSVHSPRLIRPAQTAPDEHFEYYSEENTSGYIRGG